MKKYLVGLLFSYGAVFAHPVSYTIALDVSYNVKTKVAEIICTSNSKNKCGLYNIRLLDKNNEMITTKRFPFLKDKALIDSDNKPYKMEFFLRKVPEHLYTKIFEYKS